MLAQKNGSPGGTAVSSRSWSFIVPFSFSFQKTSSPSPCSVCNFWLPYHGLDWNTPEVLHHSSYLGSDSTGFLWAEMKEYPSVCEDLSYSFLLLIKWLAFFFFCPPLNLENAVCFRCSVGSVMGQSGDISQSASVKKDTGCCYVALCPPQR